MEFAKRKNLWRDESGAAMVEFTAAALTFFLLVFGSVEFANAYYQWNAATKAVQWGARVAAVSSPVAIGLTTLTGTEGGAQPPSAMPSFDYTCAATAKDGSAGTCTVGNYSAAAMQRIVFGIAGQLSCADLSSFTAGQQKLRIGMCHLFPRIDDARKVTVRYQYTGLGYAGRPGTGGNTGGPVPTITVSLHQRTNANDANVLQFQFILIGGLMNAAGAAIPDFIDMPSFATTVTGEDLTSAATGS